MIHLTHLNGDAVVVNAELICLVEARPDTLLTMVNGSKLTVREPVNDVIDRTIAYRRRLLIPQREAL